MRTRSISSLRVGVTDENHIYLLLVGFTVRTRYAITMQSLHTMKHNSRTDEKHENRILTTNRDNCFLVAQQNTNDM